MDLREMPAHAVPKTLRHPWEIARAGFFAKLAQQELPLDRPVEVLDVGAGDGFFAEQLHAALPKGSRVRCIDAGYTDDNLAQLEGRAARGLSFARARGEQSFDAIVLLDVLEHVVDDLGFLRAIVSQSLQPGGVALISVPAHPGLYSQHDVDLGHHRRYTRQALRELLTQAGLTLQLQGGLFSSLVVLRAAQKARELARGIHSEPAPAGLAAHIATDVGQWQGGGALTSLLQVALGIDATLCALAARSHVPLPGLSHWAIAVLATRSPHAPHAQRG